MLTPTLKMLISRRINKYKHLWVQKETYIHPCSHTQMQGGCIPLFLVIWYLSRTSEELPIHTSTEWFVTEV